MPAGKAYIALNNTVIKINIVLVIHKNIRSGYSLDAPLQDGSNESHHENMPI